MITADNALPGWSSRAKSARPLSLWRSLGSALLIELALVGGLLAWAVMHPPQEIEHVIPLVMSVLQEPKIEQAIPPKPPAIRPPVLPAKVTAVPLKSPAPPVPEVRAVQDIAPPLVPQPSAFSTPAAAPSAPPPPAPPAAMPLTPTVDPALAYYSKLTAAVQAAFVVPGSAAALGFKGRARVEFHLRDGVTSNARIIQASGLGAVDRAALKAVEAAIYPAPPAILAGKDGVYQIWVACY